MQIAQNNVVTIDFTMYDDENEVLESSQEEGPLVYMHGTGELPEGLEEELLGKRAGDEVEVTLEPADAYGEYDESLVQAVPREQFDDVEDLQIGMGFDTEDGQHVYVVGLEGDDVIIDANEPYAGETVRFTVKVLGVREASEEEIEHGHVHDEGCEHESADE